MKPQLFTGDGERHADENMRQGESEHMRVIGIITCNARSHMHACQSDRISGGEDTFDAQFLHVIPWRYE